VGTAALGCPAERRSAQDFHSRISVMRWNKPTPLHDAILTRDSKRVLEVLSSGTGVDELDREGRTPLFYAAMEGDFDIASELIRHGANPNAHDRHGETALHAAAREYRLDLIKLLLEHSAYVDAEDNHGNTPLWRAVYECRGRGDAIKLLLAAGADRKRKNKHGLSPEELADTIANFDVKQFLQD